MGWVGTGAISAACGQLAGAVFGTGSASGVGEGGSDRTWSAAFHTHAMSIACFEEALGKG